MDNTLWIQVSIAYACIALFKLVIVAGTARMFLRAMIRARYRSTGGVTLTYFVMLLTSMLTCYLALSLVWPVVWWFEGRTFWFKYNGFSMARQCMRIAKPV